MDTASSATLAAPLQFLLNQLEYLRADDGFVVTLHIILWDFTLVGFFLFGEEVHRVAFLQEGITFVLLVGEDAPNRSGIPFVLATR